MKVAWFTPFHQQSAIGRVGRVVAEELSRHAEVDIWHQPSSDLLKTPLKKIAYPGGVAVDPTLLSGYDLVVYNLGNHLPNHLEIYETSRLAPGVVVLHDLVMHHFFAEYHSQFGSEANGYVGQMERHYGEDGRLLALESVAGGAPPVWETDLVADLPLFEDAIRGALGVVTHSEYSLRRVRSVFAGPVRKLYLPTIEPVSIPLADRASLGLRPGQQLLVTAGVANPNKRILEIVEVLGKHPDLFSDTVYAAVGEIESDYKAKVLSTAERFGLSNRIRLFDDFVPDDLLETYLQHADVCLTLRHPVVESASASLVEAMYAQKAIVVNDSGFYAEIPDDCLQKLTPGSEATELAPILKDLLADEELRRRLGESARQFALDQFRPDRYAAGILEMVNAVKEKGPLDLLMEGTVKRLDDLGLTDTELLDRLGTEAHHLFGDEQVQNGVNRLARMSSHERYVERTLARLRQASATVGAMPPVPGTVRGMVGARLVALARRAIFWLIPQLDNVHGQLIGFCEEQHAESMRLRREVENLRKGQRETIPAETYARLGEMERRVDALSEACGRISAAHAGAGDGWKDLEAAPTDDDPTRF